MMKVISIIIYSIILILFNHNNPAYSQMIGGNTCIACHKELGGKYVTPVKEWEKSVHKEADITCEKCHGGDPTSFEYTQNCSKNVHIPKPTEIPLFCGDCHSDANKMRQYNLRTDQLSQYRTSVHGRLLLDKGDTNVATCISCHGSHNILAKNNPMSTVYRLNVPRTCAKCHANKELMAPYGISTDQYDEYINSSHGKLLLQKGEKRAPNCTDCHGIHGAAPPGIEEVSHVCGGCHAVTAAYYSKGPHYIAMKEVGIPRCIDCHNTHYILYPSNALFFGKEKRHCGSCHDIDSGAYKVGQEIVRYIEESAIEIEKAKNVMKSVQRTGIDLSLLENSISRARTHIVEVIPVTHTLSPVEVLNYTNLVKTETLEVERKANDILKELERRKRVLKVALALILFIMILLFLKKRALRKLTYNS
ncbi:MAG: hypothetical protein HY999_06015 [Nitrospinae bacterium]|nr:hypothetical protein [Nitrospinota bacterium]